MTDDPLTTIGRCYSCARTFAYRPENTTMFLVDPETGLPPGMTVLGGLREPTPEALARAADRPVCPDCIARAEQYLDATKPQDPSAKWPAWPPGPRGL